MGLEKTGLEFILKDSGLNVLKNLNKNMATLSDVQDNLVKATVSMGSKFEYLKKVLKVSRRGHRGRGGSVVGWCFWGYFLLIYL